MAPQWESMSHQGVTWNENFADSFGVLKPSTLSLHTEPARWTRSPIDIPRPVSNTGGGGISGPALRKIYDDTGIDPTVI